MKKLFSILALILVFCMPAYAMAATEPNTKTIEETTSYESDTIRLRLTAGAMPLTDEPALFRRQCLCE